jgi:hypothetical protein
MTDNYLQIMIESLEKKLDVLDKISEVNQRQYECSTATPFDMDGYDKIMDEKDALVGEINSLDEGFTSTYELVKDDVLGNPEMYRDKVVRLQELVRQAVEKGVSVEAQEKRNKASMENAIAMKRQEFKKRKVSTKVALKYYNSASRINNVDPQLMDRKK